MIPVLVKRDGLFLCVMRPADPVLALELAEYAMKTQNQDDFDNILRVQPYTFVGFLATNQHIYDSNLKDLGKTKPGDSLVTHTHGYVQGLKLPG